MLSRPQPTMTKTRGQGWARRQPRSEKFGLYLKAFNEIFLEFSN